MSGFKDKNKCTKSKLLHQYRKCGKGDFGLLKYENISGSLFFVRHSYILKYHLADNPTPDKWSPMC